MFWGSQHLNLPIYIRRILFDMSRGGQAGRALLSLVLHMDRDMSWLWAHAWEPASQTHQLALVFGKRDREHASWWVPLQRRVRPGCGVLCALVWAGQRVLVWLLQGALSLCFWVQPPLLGSGFQAWLSRLPIFSELHNGL